MRNYLDLAQKVLCKGNDRQDRTGVGCRSLFGEQLRFDLTQGFPLVTTKRVFFRGVVVELLWMLSGSTNVKPLQEQGVHIWDAWQDDRGDLGPVYGFQWRKWLNPFSKGPEPIDQISALVVGLKENPYGRRHLVSAWNVSDLPYMRLPPCHYSFQAFVADNKLSLLVNQRSCDLFLGLPFNLASYALLTHMLAQVCDLQLGELVFNLGDVHIYHNHIDQVKLQLTREPKPLPFVTLAPHLKNIDDFDYKRGDIMLFNYDPHPGIKGEVAV